MRLKEGSIKRCAIFLYYDKQGIVDDYVIYLLNDLNKNIDKLLIVCNGTINEESEKKFRTVTQDILLRANSGFDVGGYREGLFQIGFDNLRRYDEIVLLNYTFLDHFIRLRKCLTRWHSGIWIFGELPIILRLIRIHLEK